MKGLWILCMLALALVLSVSAARAGDVNPAAPSIPASSAPAATGTIAYVVGKNEGDEIWLSEPDGTQKRRIYSAGIADLEASIIGLAWRPDAGELVFSSSYERTCSVYAADLYAIRADGSGYRRITNGPNCAALASYPKGSVTLSVPLLAEFYQVYVAGAPAPKVPSLGTVKFDNVADLGSYPQDVVAIQGTKRWQGLSVNVEAGQNVPHDTSFYGGTGESFGAYHPVWRRDGSRIGYSHGDCTALYGIVDQPSAGTSGDPLLSANDGVTPCGMAWGPTADKANQIVYWVNIVNDDNARGIFRFTENDKSSRTKILNTEIYVFDVEYLPDGSGLIISAADTAYSSNIFRYDFGSDSVTQLTSYTDKYVREFAQSPDGQKIIFELAPDVPGYPWGGGSDLYMMGIGESTPHLFAAGASSPSWSLSAPQMPGPIPTATAPASGGPSSGTSLPYKVYLPLTIRK